MAIKALGKKLTEAELYAPDLDEGELDVEYYLIPDSEGISDPYLKKAWNEAKRLIESGELENEESSNGVAPKVKPSPFRKGNPPQSRQFIGE